MGRALGRGGVGRRRLGTLLAKGRGGARGRGRGRGRGRFMVRVRVKVRGRGRGRGRGWGSPCAREKGGALPRRT